MNSATSSIMILGINADFTYLMEYYARKSGHKRVTSQLLPSDTPLMVIERDVPALIVLESDLTETLGREILLRLRSQRHTHDTPVIVCSWLDENTSRLVNDATCYLQKPILYEDFVAALKSINVSKGALYES